MRRIALLLVLFTAMAPAVAEGGTLVLDISSSEYVAAPGESNDVTVGLSPDLRRLRLRDDGAPVAFDARPGQCDRVDEHEVDCAIGGSARVLTGDGDDRVRTAGVTAWLGGGDDVAVDTLGFAGLFGEEGRDELTGDGLEGGDGADRLTLVATPRLQPAADGGTGDDVVVGSDRADRLTAGPGADRVSAGEGDDTVIDGFHFDVSGSDVFDGGPGRDHLSFAGEAARSVDLAAGAARAQDERDELAAFEGVTTGSGDDVLVGGAAPEALSGGPGDDTIDGAGGADTIDGDLDDDRLIGGDGDDQIRGGFGGDLLTGGVGNDTLDGAERRDRSRIDAGVEPIVLDPGADMLFGGAGDDLLTTSSDRWRDTADCGDGADELLADDFDGASPTCETVSERPLASLFATHRMERGPWVGVRRRRAVVEAPCEFPTLGGVLRLVRGGRAIGRGTWECAPDPDLRMLAPSESVRIRLGRRVVRRLRTGRVPVRVVMGWEDGSRRSRDRTALVRRR